MLPGVGLIASNFCDTCVRQLSTVFIFVESFFLEYRFSPFCCPIKNSSAHLVSLVGNFGHWLGWEKNDNRRLINLVIVIHVHDIFVYSSAFLLCSLS